MKRQLKGLIIRSSTELLACSDVASEYFYGERKSTLIYNGIDTESYKKADDFDALSYAQKLGADGAEKHLLVSVGRLSAQKNPIFAVEIISELAIIRDDFKYIWVGCGELENAAKDTYVDRVPYEIFVEKFGVKKYDMESLDAIKADMEQYKSLHFEI